MAVSVVMPALELAQETGKVVSWLKKEGEHVEKGEMLLEVETDKAVVEVEAQADGILAGITARVGDVIPVGQTIGWLLEPGESVPTAANPALTGRTGVAAPAAAGAAQTTQTTHPTPRAGARISPKARRLAREHGIDISNVRGSGPGGEILADDILKAASSRAAATASPASATVEASVGSGADPGLLTRIGRIMAERTTQSWTTVPHFFVSRDVDASALNAARERLLPVVERSHGVKVTHTDLVVTAVARALRQHPRMNARWTGDSIRVNPDVNIGVAMAVEDGVVAAVIRNADRLGLGELATRRQELAERAGANRLQPADIAGATFTISNLGMFGVDAFTAIIVPPQAGILAVGAIADRVIAVNGVIGVRATMTLTLSSDHRVVDGARAAAFLNDVVTRLQDVDGLTQDGG